VAVAEFGVISLHLPEQSEENHEKRQSRYPVCRKRFKPRLASSQIQIQTHNCQSQGLPNTKQGYKLDCKVQPSFLLLKKAFSIIIKN
jgi:hypothetical protein